MSRGSSQSVLAGAAGGERTPRAPSRQGIFHAAHSERLHFRLDVRRSLEMHRWMVLGIAVIGVLLAAAYLFRYWPMYEAVTQVYIEPAPAAAVGPGAAMRWPYNYNPATYDSYIQQQMLSMTRLDVLKGALDKLPGFEKSGESDQDAAKRLGRSLRVAREDSTYEVAIRARAGSAQMSADIANAVAASYIKSAAHEQRASDTERLTVLREEADRVKKELAGNRAELEALKTEPGAAAGSTAMLERTGELAGDIALLQNRYDELDGQLQNQLIEDAAPGAAHVTTAAIVPMRPVADGVVLNAVILLAAFLLLALLAPVAVHQMGSKLYVASDVERVLGFAPMAQLPEFDDVSSEVVEEQLLRLAAAMEQAFRQQNLKSCMFTGASSVTGVTTIATRVRGRMEGMSLPAVLVGAAGSRPATSASEPGESEGARPLVLIQRLVEEARAHGGAVVLADTAPLLVSAETEYLARNIDCVIVVIESGVTTRAELHATAGVLQRLDVGAVGYVLNRIALAKADAAFRNTLRAVENHVRAQRRTMEAEPVRTHLGEAEPEPAAQAQPVCEPKPPAAPAEEPIAQVDAPLPIPSAPEPFEAAPGVVQREPAPFMPPAPAPTPQQPQAPLPWWLADPFLHPGAPVIGPAAGRRSAPAPAAGAAPSAEESRLSALRNLFMNRGAESAGKIATQPSLADIPARPAELVPPEKERGTVDLPAPAPETIHAPQPEAAAGSTPTPNGKATPEVTAVPEILPPRETGGGRKEEDPAARRDRRDTWDDVAILPSWRGQYRTKD